MTLAELDKLCTELTNKLATACSRARDYQLGIVGSYSINKAEAKTQSQSYRNDLTSDLTAFITKLNLELS